MSKRKCLSILISGFMLLIANYSFAQATPLSKGSKAPMFTAKASESGNEFDFNLEKALAKGPVVVYFYPSAYTGGCDLEAHTFAEMKDTFKMAGASVIGVSADDIQRLKMFSADPDFCAGKFPVASDPNGEIATKYGLTMGAARAGAKDVKGQDITHGFIPRVTFVISKDHTVAAVFSSQADHLSPDQHVKKSLEVVRAL
jgi:peroxiredoxin